jgi:hypothetical protein
MAMSERQFLILFSGAAIAILAYVFFIFSTTGLEADISNRQTIVLEFGLAFFLALVFWYFQSKDNYKMQTVIDVQNQLTRDIHEYINENKKLVAAIRATHLTSIHTNLYAIKGMFEREVNLAANDKTDEERIRRVKMFANGYADVLLRRSEMIMSDMNFVRPYVSPVIVGEIEAITVQIDNLTTGPGEPWFANANHWLTEASFTVESIETLLQELTQMTKENLPEPTKSAQPPSP